MGVVKYILIKEWCLHSNSCQNLNSNCLQLSSYYALNIISPYYSSNYYLDECNSTVTSINNCSSYDYKITQNFSTSTTSAGKNYNIIVVNPFSQYGIFNFSRSNKGNFSNDVDLIVFYYGYLGIDNKSTAVNQPFFFSTSYYGEGYYILQKDKYTKEIILLSTNIIGKTSFNFSRIRKFSNR
jgi:hypothetical protein